MNKETSPMTKLQKKELDKRYKDFQDKKLEMHDWQDVHNELRANLQ